MSFFGLSCSLNVSAYILLFNLHTISHTELSFLDITLYGTDDHIGKEINTHTYLHHQFSHPSHWKTGLPRSQLLRLRRLCSEDSNFLEEVGEMVFFFEQRWYLPALLQNDLHAIRRTDQTDVLSNHRPSIQRSDRIPSVLTYHPLNERNKRILLRNFNILTGNPETREVFPQPPLVTHCRDSNLRDIFVRTWDCSQPSSQTGISMLTCLLSQLPACFQRYQRLWPSMLFFH